MGIQMVCEVGMINQNWLSHRQYTHRFGKKLLSLSMTCVDPDSESGSMGKKNEEKNAFFLNVFNIFIAKIEQTTSIFDFYIDF
jgi:hypothetical protein